MVIESQKLTGHKNDVPTDHGDDSHGSRRKQAGLGILCRVFKEEWTVERESREWVVKSREAQKQGGAL